MNSIKVLLTVLAMTCTVHAGGVFAQTASDAHGSMAGMDMSGSHAASDSASTKAFQAADQSMMGGMSDAPYTGNTDRDFVAHMIPHHEGAVKMAEVELKYGKDAKLRALARDIIAAQKKEISFMSQWLAAHPAKQ
jgi:uncharacterized protein (DUF305 family)